MIKNDIEHLAEAYSCVLNEGRGHEKFNLRVNLPSVEKMLFDSGYKFYTTGGGSSKYFNNDRSMSIEVYKHPDSYRQNAFATIIRYSKDGQPIAFDGVIVDPKGANSLTQQLGKGHGATNWGGAKAETHEVELNARPWKTVEDIKALGYNVIDPGTPEELVGIIGKDARQSKNQGRGQQAY